MEARAFVEAKVVVEGFHNWPSAPAEVDFLRQRHRHLFVIRVVKQVYHDNRDIEFILFGREIRAYLHEEFGTPCEFGAMSCEMIGRQLLLKFDAMSVSVYEDDENGAIVTSQEVLE